MKKLVENKVTDYRDYVIKQVIAAFERFDERTEPTADPGKPSVAPKDLPVFDEKTMEHISEYRDKALLVPTFEAFMSLLENIATEVGLNPAQDFDKLASVLNRYRTETGLEPL